ncbi:MAG TPA: hypothetical protein VJI75_05190 [Candidatus Nanoarchaeia archaeon]|nr:hypothetical protein [Candidatus Nanoarchaeia archaeon]
MDDLSDDKAAAGDDHVCTECVNWKDFKRQCWFYWESKKECSQFRNHIGEEPKIKSVKAKAEDMDVAGMIEKSRQ